MIETLVKDQFLDALSEEDLRVRVRQNRPSTLRQALEVSLELESFYLASKQRSHTIREAILEKDEEGEELDQNAICQISEVVRRTMKETRQTRTQAGLHSQHR